MRGLVSGIIGGIGGVFAPRPAPRYSPFILPEYPGCVLLCQRASAAWSALAARGYHVAYERKLVVLPPGQRAPTMFELLAFQALREAGWADGTVQEQILCGGIDVME